MRGLKICLWVGAVACLLSVFGLFLTISMVESIATMLGMDTFPDIPVIIYAVRLMSATYMAIGAFLLILALDPIKYGVLVPFSGAAAVFLAIVCFVYGLLAGMSWIWFVGDSLFCMAFGVLILVFWRRAVAEGDGNHGC